MNEKIEWVVKAMVEGWRNNEDDSTTSIHFDSDSDSDSDEEMELLGG